MDKPAQRRPLGWAGQRCAPISQNNNMTLPFKGGAGHGQDHVEDIHMVHGVAGQRSSPSYHHLPLLVEPSLPSDKPRYPNDCSSTITAPIRPPKPPPERPGSSLAGRQNPSAIGPADPAQSAVQPGPLSPGAAPQTMPGALQDAPVTPPQAISKGRPLDSPETPAGARMSKRQASQGEDIPERL